MPPPPSTAFFPSHPLWISATVSFFIGFTIGILLFFLWWSVFRLFRFVVHRCTLRRILAEEEAPANAATVFSPMLRHPDTIPFFQHLQKEGLPFLAQIIGRGGCGEVYKAEIFIENRAIPVAIKKIDHFAAIGAASLCQEEPELLNIHARQIRFGVILAVLVTGRFPSDQFFQATDDMCIVGWVRNVLRSADPAVAIDRRLMGKGFEEQMLLVLKVAYFCTYDDPSERPNSRDVNLMLSQIKHSKLQHL
ncbi:hypothetical protein OPV22_013661 [Ensete ventricosum]|uniref:Protein kinase domain-containing protein n=1 Tax=Ensete ventricosum TaxID=4639 RepID=A0AAV8QZV6_ENSVE|nr:hypothetical protein OPV22_013661 [Ensete ventricosum]